MPARSAEQSRPMQCPQIGGAEGVCPTAGGGCPWSLAFWDQGLRCFSSLLHAMPARSAEQEPADAMPSNRRSRRRLPHRRWRVPLVPCILGPGIERLQRVSCMQCSHAVPSRSRLLQCPHIGGAEGVCPTAGGGCPWSLAFGGPELRCCRSLLHAMPFLDREERTRCLRKRCFRSAAAIC